VEDLTRGKLLGGTSWMTRFALRGSISDCLNAIADVECAAPSVVLSRFVPSASRDVTVCVGLYVRLAVGMVASTA
jgi:hypothetical protein